MKMFHSFSLVLLLGCSPLIAQTDQQRMDSMMDEMDMELQGCTPAEQQKLAALVKSLMGQLSGKEQTISSLNQQLSSSTQELNRVKSELASYNSSGNQAADKLAKLQQNVDDLQRENSALKQHAASGEKTRQSAAELALYSSQLKGQVDTLKQQLAESQTRNQQLQQQVAQLQAAPAKSPIIQTASSAPAVVQVAQPAQTIVSSGGKIIGKVLSVRREKAKTTKDDALSVGVALTNTTNKTIYGVLVGPDINAIDNANNMFANSHINNVRGITTCQYGGRLYNKMDWCEKQLESGSFSTTSFRPGVPVNVLVTLPAVSSDPDTETRSVNTTLFLLLQDEEKGTFEKYPIDTSYMAN